MTEPAEDAIELRQRLKSDGKRYLADAQTTVVQERERLFESDVRHVVDKISSSHLFEFFAEMIRTDVYESRDLRERDFVVRMFVDKSPCPPDFYWFGMAAVRRGGMCDLIRVCGNHQA